MLNFSLPAMLDELASKDLVLGLFLIGAGLVVANGEPDHPMFYLVLRLRPVYGN